MTALSGVPTEIVRLSRRKRSADFSLSHPQRAIVPLGGKAGLKIDVLRSGGFTGPITLTATGLPRGVTAAGTWAIPEGQTTATVQLEAAADADVSAVLCASWDRPPLTVNQRREPQVRQPSAFPRCVVPSNALRNCWSPSLWSHRSR